MANKVSHRFGDLKFPTDKHGVTYELKKAMIKMASRIQGHPDKKATVDATLKVLLAHLNAKYEFDKKHLEARKAKQLAKAQTAQAETDTPESQDEPGLFDVDEDETPAV